MKYVICTVVLLSFMLYLYLTPRKTPDSAPYDFHKETVVEEELAVFKNNLKNLENKYEGLSNVEKFPINHLGFTYKSSEVYLVVSVEYPVDSTGKGNASLMADKENYTCHKINGLEVCMKLETEDAKLKSEVQSIFNELREKLKNRLSQK